MKSYSTTMFKYTSCSCVGQLSIESSKHETLKQRCLTLKQHWLSVSCLLGYLMRIDIYHAHILMAGLLTQWNLSIQGRWPRVERYSILALIMLKYFCINYGDQRVFQFEIIINDLPCSFCFIWISVLWVYGHYKFLILSVRGPFLYVIIWRL